jgi:PilZ domain
VEQLEERLMSIETSGADYLRRLREDIEHPQVSQPSTVTAEPEEAPGERRRSPRYKCEGSAEFRVGGSDVRTWGTFTDISMNGCYVEMTATFPVGSIVDLGLELKGLRARVSGDVRVSYPLLGMGIAFRDVSPEDQLGIEEMIEQLNPLRAVKRNPEPEEMKPIGTAMPVVLDLAAALRALTEFFETRGLLSKEEFIRVLRRSQGV